MDKILLGHGSGGRLMHDLIARHLAPAFGISGLGDAALLRVPAERLAVTTDSFVVSPLFFEGGNIGDLAVNGTVNDLAVSGARPLYLTAGFIIEEGLPLRDLECIVASMARAARAAGVRIVAGDTKVVERGKGDGIFINTTGIGVMIDGMDIAANRIQPGDAVLVSGTFGNHGASIIAARNGIHNDPPIPSDSRPLNGLVQALAERAGSIHFMRDPTRGGLATTLKEAALESGLCIRIREKALPIEAPVQGVCDLLGIDPLFVANEGILVAIVEKKAAAEVLSIMGKSPAAVRPAIIGEVAPEPASMVLLETRIGGSRIIDMLPGEQLPRIC